VEERDEISDKQVADNAINGAKYALIRDGDE
jgi:hypothetical protein